MSDEPEEPTVPGAPLDDLKALVAIDKQLKKFPVAQQVSMAAFTLDRVNRRMQEQRAVERAAAEAEMAAIEARMAKQRDEAQQGIEMARPATAAVQ